MCKIDDVKNDFRSAYFNEKVKHPGYKFIPIIHNFSSIPLTHTDQLNLGTMDPKTVENSGTNNFTVAVLLKYFIYTLVKVNHGLIIFVTQ